MRNLQTVATIGALVLAALMLPGFSAWLVNTVGSESTKTEAETVIESPASRIEPLQFETPEAVSVQQTSASTGKTDRPVPTAGTVAVRGWVGNAAGAGVGGIDIEVENRGFSGEEIAIIRARSNSRGEFVLENLVPGRQYRLEIHPQREYAAHSLDSFTVSNAAALNKIILDRIDLVDVDGMIVDTNLAPVGDFELAVRSLAVEFPDRVIRSDSSGYFNLRAFPAGKIRIATNASDYYRIKGIELQPNEYRNLTIVIDRGNYHLSGWIGDDGGVPLAGVHVWLKSAFKVDGYHSYSYRSTVTDANGAFEFSQLGGHRLTLGVHAKNFNTYIQKHEFRSFSDSVAIRLKRQG